MSEQQLGALGDAALPARGSVPATPSRPAAAAAGWRNLGLPGARQAGLIVAVAVALALVVVGMLWMERSTDRVLYQGMSDRDAAAVVDALRVAGIDVRIDTDTGAVRVPATQLHEARFKLAAEGLPRGAGLGFEFLQEQGQMGSSQFMETARYRHALENELARSVASLGSVESARVHLAIPARSAFVRESEEPSASVILKLFPGRVLDPGQVSAITHLVSTAVPGLATARVSVIDQLGKLLSSESRDAAMSSSMDQLDYARRVEEGYVRRIEAILAPIVGAGQVRAQASVDVDFTMLERTEESYAPGGRALRSEQMFADAVEEPPLAEGVPGALGNQVPDGEGQADADAAPAAPDDATLGPGLRARRWTRNFELDKSIVHSRVPTGRVRRLSVAVVVDDRAEITAEGETQREAFSAEELERLTALVKDAVGFDAERGDTVRVVNSTFRDAQLPPAPAWYERPWLIAVGELLLAALVLIALLAMVVRPLMRLLMQYLSTRPRQGRGASTAMSSAGDGNGDEDGPAVLGPYADEEPGNLPRIDGAQDYQAHVRIAQNVAAGDPRRAAQVLKGWLDDGG